MNILDEIEQHIEIMFDAQHIKNKFISTFLEARNRYRVALAAMTTDQLRHNLLYETAEWKQVAIKDEIEFRGYIEGLKK